MGSYPIVGVLQKQHLSFALVTQKILLDQAKVYLQASLRDSDVLEESLGIWGVIDCRATKLTEFCILCVFRVPTIILLRGIAAIRSKAYKDQDR